MDGMATGLSTCITKDGQTTVTANLPMGTYRHTGVSDAQSSTDYASYGQLLAVPLQLNCLVNPSGEINQRGTTSTADDAYGGPDAWYTLVQTGAISVSQGTNGEDGTPFYERLTQSQASAQRMGRAQIIESANCRHLRGQTAALTARVRLSATATLRYAILEWTGTADAVTSEVVNDWTSSTYSAGNFFTNTTLTVTAVGSVALTAATWANITVLTGSVSSSMNNLIVFFWTEATAAQNVTLDFAKRQLAKSTVSTPFNPRNVSDELRLCRRYLRVVKVATNNNVFGIIFTTSTNRGLTEFSLGTSMRATPTAAISSATPVILDVTGGTISSINQVEASGVDATVVVIQWVTSGTTAFEPGRIRFTTAASDFLTFSAEM